MNSTEKLVMMANQIAANLAHDDEPAVATAEHIRLFWDPRMKAMLEAHGSAGLSPIAASALAMLDQPG